MNWNHDTTKKMMHWNYHKKHCEGYTLIELLIVLFIILIISGMVAVGVGRFTQSRAPQQLAERLRQVLPLAIEYAMIHSETLRLIFEEEQYVFYRLDHKPLGKKIVWKKITAPDFLKPYPISEDIILRLKDPQKKDSQTFLEKNQLDIFPSLMVSPAIVFIGTENQPDQYQLLIEENGEVSFEKPE
jgi:prepilin-type N-terminal cleavage/methylation domain-containing protein